MGEVNYAPLIDDMVWSFSRIESYNDCPYRWYLRYIRQCPDEEKFYSSYGQLLHRLIEQYYKGMIAKEDMVLEFLRSYSSEVKGVRPKESTVKKYIDGAVEYLKNFDPFPYRPIGIEKRVAFEIEGIRFVGFIDFLGIDDRDGEIVLIDNKSRDLKPRSGRAKPTQKDLELDVMLRQLYLYSAAVISEYGKPPKELCFNCYRTGTFIREPFREDQFQEAKDWAVNTIQQVREDSDFYPNPDFFSCYWICGVNENCEYWQNE